MTLALQPQTLQFFFKDLIGPGRLDKDSCKELGKKYYMSDADFKILVPPTLSDTKLHHIQAYDVSGVYNRLLSILVNSRNNIKMLLRAYEQLGEHSQVFGSYIPVRPYDLDTSQLIDSLTPASMVGYGGRGV